LLDHRHRSTQDHHGRVDRLEGRAQKLSLKAQPVENIADQGNEQLAPNGGKQVLIGHRLSSPTRGAGAHKFWMSSRLRPAVSGIRFTT